MKTAIVTFQGFTEDLGSMSGTEILWQSLRDFASRETVIGPPVAWDARTDRIAAFLQRQKVEKVIVVGYSWGGGFGAQRFARECAERGIAVPLMLLCDAVYRPLWLPPFAGLLPLAFRALIPGSAKIEIPRNVRRVVSVRQTLSLPMGHPISGDLYATTVEPSRFLSCGHTAIDAAPEWHALALSEIQKFLNLHQK